MIALRVLIAVLVACASSGCKSEGGGIKGKQARPDRKLEYPVQVAPLTLRQMKYSVSSPGSIEAFQQVQITARVAGAVDRVSFTEGQVVKEGQILVTIESERYRVAVGQAQAALTKAQATVKGADAELQRRVTATQEHAGLIPGEEIAAKQTAVSTAKADVESSRQALQVASLNLRDSYVRAPIAGVVQTRTVQTGQYLQPGAVLATILQRDPLILRFQVSEQDAPRLKTGMKATLSLRETERTFEATISLVSGNADPQTRLVPVTAQLDTTEHQYWLRPGAFCEVNVPVGDAREAIVIPTMAVQPTERGNVAWVIDGTTAHSRLVTTGMHTPEGGIEIKKGLAAGEVLVVRGIEPLSEGAPVKISARTTLQAFEQKGDGGTPKAPAAATASGAVVVPAASGPPAAKTPDAHTAPVP